jgi:formylglycine-generating enzyme required for sulfatase activity
MGCRPDDLSYRWGGRLLSCPEESQPAHEVVLSKGFWVAETKVTQVAWRKVFGEKLSAIAWKFYPVGDDYPAVATWDEARTYCESIGGRLLTEAEWEYAARVTYPGIKRYLGDFELVGTPFRPLKGDLPNPYGLYDLFDNLSEWVSDWFDDEYYRKSPKTDPHGPPEGKATANGGSHVDRGGVGNGNLDPRDRPLGVADRGSAEGPPSFRCAMQE